MGILIDQNTVALVQGITGKQGSLQTRLMLEYGTNIIAGVTPGKGGEQVHGVPVFETIKDAFLEYRPEVSIVFVPAESASNAVKEAMAGGVKTIIVITEGIPVRDTIEVMWRARHAGARIVGPNTPGIITPGKCKLGIMPQHIFKPGRVGVVSRSGTLTYEIAASMTQERLGQSTCIGIGGDPIVGLGFIDILKLFEKDPQTDAVALIGEIGGDMEELAADFIAKTDYSKPVVAYIAGLYAPPEKRMGHAGAIVTEHTGDARSKIAAFESVGVEVAERPSEVAHLLRSALRE